MTFERHDAYRAFVRASDATPADDGYLFDTPRCRFVPEPSDELVAAPGARVVRRDAGVFVELPGGASLQIHGLDFQMLRSTFARLPCRYSRLALELGPPAASFVEQAFSRVLFAPSAVAELELALPALEIVRFPGSPYEIVRSYWRNAAAVRRCIDERCACGTRAQRAAPPDARADAGRSRAVRTAELVLPPASQLGRRAELAVLRRGQMASSAWSERDLRAERACVAVTGGTTTGAASKAQRRAPFRGAESPPEGVPPQGAACGSAKRSARPWLLPPRPATRRPCEGLVRGAQRLGPPSGG